ncbi:hypothetical protein [Actinoplanes sp. M2I2]|uniref:hypothetical protein n=1 Tax=Actinoplanes sp. M2I2 TaxID=1734444 RepID=UPI002022087A|nr:hypothetical protein [Actinoplanes sp. M2I2]
MVDRVEHWFNRKYRDGRRDIYLDRTRTGWQVVGRIGGADGTHIIHDFGTESDARTMLERMRESAPDGENGWALMPKPPKR